MGRLVLLATALLALLVVPARGATFNVTDAGDDGDDTPGDAACATAGAVCTLRACIEEANDGAGADTCNVAALNITPASILPTISESLTITGCAAAGASANNILGGTDHVLTADIIGSGTIDAGLLIVGSGIVVTLRCLEISGFDNTGAAGVKIQGAPIVTLESNILAENGHGVDMRGGFVTIGGLTSTTGNIIRDNLVDGVFCSGNPSPITGPAIVGNVITGNEDNVYLDQCNDTAIGGGSTSHRNVISGATHYGIDIVDSDRTSIAFNRIGTNRAGTAADPNADDGIWVTGTSRNTLIGPSNQISANTEWGITNDATTSWTTATGNQIGLNASGTPNLCNGLGNYQDLDAGDFAENTVCPATPTPTPTPAGCCNFGNVRVDATPLTCGDTSFLGALTSLADCQALVAVFDTPGPGTPTPYAVSFVDGVACPDPNAGSCAAPPTATPTPTASATATQTTGPTVADSTGLCRATGDKQPLASDTILTTSPQTLATMAVVVPEAADPWFFLANAVVFNQTSATAQLTVTLSEAGGLFEPQTKTFDINGAGTFTVQVPFQTWNITPDTYTLRMAAAVNRKNALVAQTESYVGAWRLGSSSSGCPASAGGSGFTICLSDTVNTAAAAFVETGDELPARVNLAGCFARVTSAIAGGFTLGLEGAATAWGNVSGSVDSTNEGDLTRASSTTIVADQPVRLTSTHTSGQFQNTTGAAEVTCWCSQELGAPVE